ncbi:MAG: glycosyltransferase family 4 protein [Ferruginibacter sp.]
MKEVIFINSHPIQYFAPMYKYMNQHGVKTKAWYCSDESIKGGRDKQFGVDVKWDIPLLEGYEYIFYKNYSRKPSHFAGFFGLINLGVITRLFKIPKSVIVVHGWHYFTHFFVLLLGKLRGHTICLRCEMPQKQEALKTGWKMNIKRWGLKYILFPRINFFLYIGTQNRLFYKSFGIDDQQLIFCPYSVDDQRFRNEYQQLKPNIAGLKDKMGIPTDAKIILYSGKYMDKKRPLDLVNAFHQLNHPACWLVMVGEGELRKDMERCIAENNIKQVILTGFVNQSQVAEFYAISDVFVMCSTIGETWGLSVNEAMNFGLPVIVSDLTGCSEDMVKNGDNGYIFETGNTHQLALKLEDVLLNHGLTMNTPPEAIVNKHSYSTVTENIKPIRT